jgi:two-component system, LuxR family, response regulator FixJ
VVDDDASMRMYLRRLLVVKGFCVETCTSGAELLAKVRIDQPACVLLDVSMPTMGGLEVQRQLRQRGVSHPVIFLTGSADIAIAVAAMREGAADFIEKPFDPADLVARVRHASDGHGDRVDEDAARRDVQARLDCLTPRESCVLDHVVVGETSKETARALGISHRTVEVHRRHLMDKLHAPTLADLVRMRLVAGEPRGAV